MVRAYIERIKEVNPLLNAIVEERFTDAIEDAIRADKIIQTTPQLVILKNYPILGVPFTVKESCSLKGTNDLIAHGVPYALVIVWLCEIWLFVSAN